MPSRRSKPMVFRTQADLDRALRTLVKHDPRLRPILAATGNPPLRQREPGFAGLAQIIVGQQVSTASAAAIWGRLSAAFAPFHHAPIHRATPTRLGNLGLSAAKIKTLKLIAAEIHAERLDLASLSTMDADAAHATLTALHGVGPWTADVYLLFCLGHGDAWPAADVGIQEGIRLGFHCGSRPTAKEMISLAEVWRPIRGAAAHLWWAYNRAIRGLESTPAAPPVPKASKWRVIAAAPP